MKKMIVSILMYLLCVSACKKDTQEKYCWNITSPQLITIKTVCDKTAAEITAEYPDGWYYKSDEPKKCWIVTGTSNFIKDCPASLIAKVLPNSSYSEVDCGYCAFWFYREKRKYKPTSQITFSGPTKTQLCGDTLHTLYRGREVILRESVDSLITRQFSDDGINW